MLLILTTAPDQATAERLAEGLVAARLAACVNILPPMRSIYRWQDNLHHEPELQLQIKTRSDGMPAVAAWLRQHHPYELPEIIGIETTLGAANYLNWIDENTASE
ncbi:MAG: divalent-cation tolerance protein CutA [Thiotrichales bacterium]